MNAGKSTALIQVAHNYSERNMTPIVIKPSLDTKSGSQISSRIGISKETDFVIQPDDNLNEILTDVVSDCILVDEAQFLTSDQVNDLRDIAIKQDIPVICYGIRTDFVMQ
jgi:thymidine kinase